eukprot:3418121-Rhodomonas_salina.2
MEVVQKEKNQDGSSTRRSRWRNSSSADRMAVHIRCSTLHHEIEYKKPYSCYKFTVSCIGFRGVAHTVRQHRWSIAYVRCQHADSTPYTAKSNTRNRIP